MLGAIVWTGPFFSVRVIVLVALQLLFESASEEGLNRSARGTSNFYLNYTLAKSIFQLYSAINTR